MPPTEGADAGLPGPLVDAGIPPKAQGDSAHGGGMEAATKDASNAAADSSSRSDPADGGPDSTSGETGSAPVIATPDAGVPGKPGELLAFPGAEGFGRLATGGRGGAVYHVTKLDDSGPGSLRDAVSMPGRTVVFEVSGVIKLASRLVFSNHLTIAGQTAPGGGVEVYGDGSSFTNADHAIVRYMRFRMGVGGESGKDTIAIARGHDMIFDHCSISWGRDGTFDLNQESGYELRDITLSDSIVAQGLQTHSTGGLLVADGVSVLRSLYIDNNSRNPKARQTTQWVNNVVYNWVVSGYILGDTTGRSDGYMVGNYFIPGPETKGGTLDSPSDAYHLYATGNYYDSDKDGALGGRLLGQGDYGSVSWEASPSKPFPPVTQLMAREAYDHIVAKAGASRWRDEVDRYVMAELTSLGKKGATISDEAALGLRNAVGDVPSGVAAMDSDRDGMPDSWESSHGLAPDQPDDRNRDRNGDGWTNLEEYINSLAP
ncbi:MAG TPA: pectate lyase [Polyangiaceae bacterium]|nr:pectate lyase [Polyangiaceae bacterium]